MKRLKRWFVVTPNYEYQDIINPEIGGPWQETCDVIELQAYSARDAVKLGVVQMLKDRRHFKYCRDQRLNWASPYTGVYAERACK